MEFKETSDGPVVTLLPLPPNCKPWQRNCQMSLIRLSLNVNTCILATSCLCTYFSLSLLFQELHTKDWRLKHYYGFLCRAFIPYLSCAGFPSENMWKLVVMQIRTAGLSSWLANLVL